MAVSTCSMRQGYDILSLNHDVFVSSCVPLAIRLTFCRQHTIGHICALARTTPTTFIFMGGDVCHHCSEFRPTEYLPIPTTLSPSPITNPPFAPSSFCPSSVLRAIHPQESATKPFYRVKEGQHLLQNFVETQKTLEKMTEFDADENVLVVIAHDRTLLDVLEFYPANANS